MLDTINHNHKLDSNNYALAVATILSSENRGNLIKIDGFRFVNPSSQDKMVIHIYSGLITEIVHGNAANNDYFTIYYLGVSEKEKIYVHKNQIEEILKEIKG